MRDGVGKLAFLPGAGSWFVKYCHCMRGRKFSQELQDDTGEKRENAFPLPPSPRYGGQGIVCLVGNGIPMQN